MLENIIKANELAVRGEKHPIALSKLDFIVDMIIMEEARISGSSKHSQICRQYPEHMFDGIIRSLALRLVIVRHKTP